MNENTTVPPPPSINVQPPSVVTPASYPVPGIPPSLSKDIQPPQLNTYPPPETIIYPPPTERAASPPRSRSQPPSSGRKSVQFAEKPEVSTLSDTGPVESEASSPERHRHKHKHSHSRGYEAGDDTDSTPDDQRRSSRDHFARSLDPDSINNGEKRRHHHRRRSHEPSSARGDPGSNSRGAPLDRVASPADSEATVELPDRYDEKGRKIPEAGSDPIADMIAGKGAAGKIFGNFIDGLFGPEGRGKKGK